MARKIRFPLKMKNEAEVRTLEELQQNFDLESVLGYFADGKLVTWLADRYYEQQAEAVEELSPDMADLNARLCEILGVEYQSEEDETDLELIQRRNEKRKILNSITDDKHILDNVDFVAMDQDELFDILDEDPKTVYLYGESFSIPFGKTNVKYIGIGNPRVVLEKGKDANDYSSAQIHFENVQLPEQPFQDVSQSSYARQESHSVFQSNTASLNGLNLSKGEQLYLNNQFEEAFPLIQNAAKNGIPRAMFILAMMYLRGYGCKQSEENCREWLRKAYGSGEPLSMMAYAGHCCEDYDQQERIFSNYSEKTEWLALRGDTLAQFVYGCHLIEHTEEKHIGFEYIIKAAEMGFSWANEKIGNCYYDGVGTVQDYEKAIEWYKNAAEQDEPFAQNRLGLCYYYGIGVEQDYIWASIWFHKVARKGYASPQYSVGAMYERGIGFLQDYAKAAEWYRKAAEQGSTNAQYRLGRCYYYGNGVALDHLKAAEWYRKAAEQGDANAQEDLGDCYYYGEGVAQDYTKAVEWYRKAAEQGNDWAQCYLGECYWDGDGVQRDTAKAVEWFRRSARNGNERAKMYLGALGYSF